VICSLLMLFHGCFFLQWHAGEARSVLVALWQQYVQHSVASFPT